MHNYRFFKILLKVENERTDTVIPYTGTMQATALLVLTMLQTSTLAAAYTVISFTCKDVGYRYTDYDAVCVGVPLYCRVLVAASSSCDTVLTAADISINVMDNSSLHSPPSSLLKMGTNLFGIPIDYRASGASDRIIVRANSTLPQCSFAVDTDSEVIRACMYPLRVLYGGVPESVGAGDSFLFPVNFSHSTQDTMHRVSLTVAHHRSLTLTLNRVSGGSAVKPCSGLVCVDVHGNHVAMVWLNVSVDTLLLPMSELFVKFTTAYTQHASENPYPIVLSDMFPVLAPQKVLLGDSVLTMLNYEGDDVAALSFPPQPYEAFVLTVPVGLPCVTSDITVTVDVPQFVAVEMTHVHMFFLNITRVKHLQGNGFFSYSSGGSVPLDSTALPRVVLVNNDNGTERVIASYGELQQSVPCSGCKWLKIGLFGTTLSALPSRYIRLQDNFTVTMTHTAERDGSTAVITTVDIVNVNVSRPDISLSISTHTHDANDMLVMKFSLVHDKVYSGMSAWNLTYKFQVDSRLEVAENITYCHKIEGNEPNCSDVPFINHTISGFFEE